MGRSVLPPLKLTEVERAELMARGTPARGGEGGTGARAACRGAQRARDGGGWGAGADPGGR